CFVSLFLASAPSLFYTLSLHDALPILAAIHRENARSSEAGLKYFVLGALGTGMMLYGISLTYGYTGSVDFGQVAAIVSGSERQRSEEHTSEPSHVKISYAVFCLKKKNQ